MIGDGQENGLLAARPGGQPDIAHAGGIAQAGVERNQLGPVHFALDDALGVGVEIMARFQMAGDEQNDAGVGVIGAGPVEAPPQIVAEPRAAGADVGVAVVAVHAPGLNAAVGVAVLAGTADMVHNAVFAPETALAHLGGDVGQRFFPTDPLPFARAPFAHSLERVEDALRVVNLVVGGGAFGAVTAATAGVLGVTFKLLDFQAGLIHVSQQAAGAFAVEADGGDEHIAVGYFARPLFAAVLDPIVP